ncbi:MAG TPA: tetratricopeptide repeat protein [Geobacteraceae bacterium]
MKKESLLLIVVSLIVGLLGGYLVFNLSTKKDEAPAGGGMPLGAGSPTDYQQRIAEGEKIVAREPKNLQVWIQLGNDYFDTDQPQKAVNAYGKALEIEPNNPNILTDQGVMFRRLGWFDKALANFEKAQQIDPKHVQSIYNMGIVYAYDLKQADKAIQTWTRYLQFDSTSPQAQQVKGLVEQLKNNPAEFFKSAGFTRQPGQ